ncbi:phytyl ester synthase 1, chloroplastic isoform X3 [Andrographis paniculata]|uniref:phytyl ester synthase 1, chloroplastic isoform X3 n=1 Tax=Andrographis paniculata TaxID=175694 RepID=UPI0021E85391|nr:phytyl ester synthase 1, chloroplastic isoform X3 [Andrographis paniculata]
MNGGFLGGLGFGGIRLILIFQSQVPIMPRHATPRLLPFKNLNGAVPGKIGIISCISWGWMTVLKLLSSFLMPCLLIRKEKEQVWRPLQRFATMDLKTELCCFSGAKIYPGKGIKYIPADSQTLLRLPMASGVRIFGLSVASNNPSFGSWKRVCCKHPLRCLAATADSTAALSADYVGVKSVAVNGVSHGVDEEKLAPLWDDGFGQETVKEYLDYAKDLIRPDGGPIRWFTPVACGPHLKGSPVLLFLPGMDGLGLGLVLQHRPLGKVFDVRCMHIPVHDRTPFEGLVDWVEETVRAEHASTPNKPIYLVGDSFGGCLALAVAARNQHIDLVLILANPATSIESSQLHPIFPLFDVLPSEFHIIFPYLLSSIMGDPVKMASVNINKTLPPGPFLEQLANSLTALLPRLSVLADIIPKETMVWKLKLIKHAAAYANSRLHAVKAEVLLLASGKDNMLPSQEEARRLFKKIQNIQVRYFKDSGHTLLLEDGFNLLSVIKGVSMYRRSSNHDFVMDFIPPSAYDFDQVEQNGWFRNFVGPVILSTLEDGKIVRGLAGVPDEGPVLLVGYHMLLGLELSPLVEQFLREKKILIRGVAHPTLFAPELLKSDNQSVSFFDTVKIFGALPVTASNLFKLLKTESHVLLYPGGAREALHQKGETYKLFWPNQPEFVRMAAKFGATIVPFGVVGEDDIAELALDFEDQLKIPIWGDKIRSDNKKYRHWNVRSGQSGEVANQALFFPALIPKIPGRFYYYFGKPIPTKGRKELLKDREKAQELYMHIKSQVEENIAYLLEKRKRDPYRNVLDRTVFRAFHSRHDTVPTFEP